MTTHVHPDAPRPVWQGLDGLRPTQARAGRSPWLRLAVGRLRGLNRAVLGGGQFGDHLADLVANHPHITLPPPPAPDDSAAVLFARDSNHQPVGVYYTAAELSQVRDIVADLLTARPQDRARPEDRPHPHPPPLRSHLRTETGWVAASLIVPGRLPARLRADPRTGSACSSPGF